MAGKDTCPKCGSPLGRNAPAGVCPQCLMELGLPSDAGGKAGRDGAATSTTPPGGFIPPEPEELSEQFPQLEIVALLGQGGMGAVYKARQKQLDRLVALKILPPAVGPDPAFSERFTREARSLAKLNHPNIVTVYDFGHTDRGLYFFIMEFVEGTDLRHVIHAKELTPEQALAVVPQICDALQYAHEEGIVHRDVKPENILLDKKGRVKIADFGLARLLDRAATALTLTQLGQRMGTPHYMAPEQVEHPHDVDHRADIYSLGVVFYEMLTGELPLGRFDPPSRKVHVDVRLDEVVLHTLEKEPARRYQHASEVKTDVEDISVHTKSADDTRPREALSPRFSRKALAGIVCLPFLIFFVGMLSTQQGYSRFEGLLTPTGEDWRTWLFTLVVAVLGIAAPFAMIILGAMALHDIRHSRGRLVGLPLALADIILLPLLVSNFAIFVFFTANQSPFEDSQRFWTVPAAIVICLVLDFLFSRWCWRKSKVGIETSSSAATDYQSASAKQSDRRNAFERSGIGRDEELAVPAPQQSGRERGISDEEEEGLAAARGQLRIPAIGVRITGMLDIVFVAVMLMIAGHGGLPGLVEMLIVVGLMLTPGIAILLGGIAMPKCKSHGLAVAAAIVAVIPIHPAFWIGLPFGIWALVVLSRPEIQRAFARESRRILDISRHGAGPPDRFGKGKAERQGSVSDDRPSKAKADGAQYPGKSSRDTKKGLGIASMCTAIFGIVGAVLVVALFTGIRFLGIHAAPLGIVTATLVGTEVVALVMGIAAWRSPYGKVGVGISGILLLLVGLIMPVRVETVSNTATSVVPQQSVQTPDNPAYEKAPGTTTRKIQVGPTEFSVNAVVRWGPAGRALLENGKGWVLGQLDFKTPDYSAQSQWMDIANIYVGPDSSQYDVLELRVFDHETRKLLQLEYRDAIGYDINNGIVQLRSVGGLLPATIDIWMRVLHNPENSPMWRLNAEKGASVNLENGALLFREIREGRWSYSMKSPDLGPPDGKTLSVARIEWNERTDDGRTLCTAVFDLPRAQTGDSNRYQIAAVAKDGTRHIPDYPHFLSVAAGHTQVIVFDLSADSLSHFEIRPFHGRDRFYFDGIQLPHVEDRLLAAPPTVPVRLNGKEGRMAIDAFAPARVNVTVLKGMRASGVESSSYHGWVKMTEEPHKNIDSMVTVIYDIDGLRVKKSSFSFLNAEGRELVARSVTSSSTGHPYGFTVGYEVARVALEKVDHLLFSIKR